MKAALAECAGRLFRKIPNEEHLPWELGLLKEPT